MNAEKYLSILQDKIGAAVFATVDENQQPDSRYINVGVANEKGVFFMTSPSSNFYKQLEANGHISITGMAKADGEIEVIRIKGAIRPLGQDMLEEVLKDNPYVKDVYPDEEKRKDVQVFQVYKGTGNYMHLQKRIKEDFVFGE
ncbi:pyridoxamine 5'-phosphate oxidase family protein [Aerococcaceae bacterium WS4759]|uniref:Pyridoxamine 5'-phosphate oxidase family protein n=1 Tax=Fundicoccus ignavus TaxID=2664442 RepID=A0A6I2GWS4_9LACT|nr:pyridoxamine 5'-phosphate oxidase family protein [Fundicoccus ignavus]MRI84793.1 pyridoxamine 5'-phosphate oxidase family protein [Fundicoccus ignavus]